MKLKLKDQSKQDKEVAGWWNSEKTKKWHDFTYDINNPLSNHLILRQNKIINYLRELNLPKDSKILELGCGGGQTAIKICEMGYKYVGMDISKHLCDETERKIKEYVNLGKAEVINQSIEKEYPYPDSEFDACIVIGASQYVGDLEFYFKEIKRSLKKDSYFLIAQANMYPLFAIQSFRLFVRNIFYKLCDQEFWISASFKSMLFETKFGNYFRKYENSKFMNSSFMTEGEQNLKFAIKKRLYSRSRLKKIFNLNGFEVSKETGATFFWPKKNYLYWLWFSLDFILQKLLDFRIFPFLMNVSDNIIFIVKKK